MSNLKRVPPLCLTADGRFTAKHLFAGHCSLVKMQIKRGNDTMRSSEVTITFIPRVIAVALLTYGDTGLLGGRRYLLFFYFAILWPCPSSPTFWAGAGAFPHDELTGNQDLREILLRIV